MLYEEVCFYISKLRFPKKETLLRQLMSCPETSRGLCENRKQDHSQLPVSVHANIFDYKSVMYCVELNKLHSNFVTERKLDLSRLIIVMESFLILVMFLSLYTIFREGKRELVLIVLNILRAILHPLCRHLSNVDLEKLVCPQTF